MKIDPKISEVTTEERDAAEVKWMSRRSWLTAVAGAGAGFAGWKWLKSRSKDDGALGPLRQGFRFDETVSRALHSPNRLAATFPEGAIGKPRSNGSIGLESPLDMAAWRLRVSGLASGEIQEFTLDDIKRLPRTEVVTQLKCIEGWDFVVKWTGVALRDFLESHPVGKAAAYAALATPDRKYYVGLDLASAMHPQTLLCYEMNGEPLSLVHGAPLRLAIPSAYGIKHLKRVGTLDFTPDRPADYWAERGYDWYSIH